MIYLIEAVYIIEGIATLVLSKYEGSDLPLWGQFSMRLANAEEIGLDRIADLNFYIKATQEQVFFGELSSDSYNAINQSLGLDSAEGLLIEVHNIE